MRAVVFANGVIEDIRLVRRLILNDDFIVSADGGLRFARALGLFPKLVIGDLDSISEDDLRFIQENDIEILKFPMEKNQTDLELALTELSQKGFDHILVVGALGGRIDQTLANIGLIQLFAEKNILLEFDDGVEQVSLVTSRMQINGSVGDTVSLIPVCSEVHGISTLGLKYLLKNEFLNFGKTRGISNEMTKETAEISISSGSLLCIHTRKFGKKEK